MKKLSAVIAAATFCATPVLAADMAVKAPPAPPAAYSWTGWYVGGNVGYGWGRDTGGLWDNVVDTVGAGFVAYMALGGNALPGVKPKGIVGGGQIGYNWQVSPLWVLGLVADLQASGMRASGTGQSSPAVAAVTLQTNTAKIENFGTIRGKVGASTGKVLFYGTGGLAYGEVRSDLSLVCISAPCAGTAWQGTTSTLKAGWAAGVGAEAAVSPNLTVGVEYLHVDLGAITATATGFPGISFGARSAFAADLVRLMLSMKLN